MMLDIAGMRAEFGYSMNRQLGSFDAVHAQKGEISEITSFVRRKLFSK